MSNDLKAEPILLGKITAPHGIRGGVKVAVYSGDFGNILSLTSVLLKSGDGRFRPFEISHASAHGKKAIISFAGYEDISLILPLVGSELYAQRQQLPELAEGEFYWCDLLGLRVETDGGEELGELTDIISTGSNDVYVVKSGLREYLIPALDDVVLEVNLENGTMKVSPPEGLFDL